MTQKGWDFRRLKEFCSKRSSYSHFLFICGVPKLKERKRRADEIQQSKNLERKTFDELHVYL